MALVQWVNLEKKDIYAKDSDIDSKDRCGKLTIKATFDKDKVPLNFKAKVTPVGSKNAVYTADEEKRNPNFKMTRGAVGQSGTKQVEIEESIQLPAAGGNKYKIEAQDANGKVVSSIEVETMRKLYYQEMTMNDSNGSVAATSLSPMESHSLKHFIKLEKVGTAAKIPYKKTITMHTSGNISSFGSDVSAAFNIDADHKKVGIAAVFSDYISSMGPAVFRQTMTIGTAIPQLAISPSDVVVMGTQFLWYGLDDADDLAKVWFRGGQVKHTDPKTGATLSHSITKANVEITGTKYFTYGGHHQIKIKRDSGLNALLSKTSGTLEFVILVNIASGWTNGFSWNPGGVDLITTAKRVAWADMPANTTEYTWNHEVGHRFGMVAYGNKKGIAGYQKLPDGPSTLYGENRGVNDKTHAGPHCEKGATYSAVSGWSGTPACVMFGANGIGSNHAPKEYCSECEPIVRKLDLS